MWEEINELREALYTILDSEEKDLLEILKLSQELDEKIVRYYNTYYSND